MPHDLTPENLARYSIVELLAMHDVAKDIGYGKVEMILAAEIGRREEVGMKEHGAFPA